MGQMRRDRGDSNDLLSLPPQKVLQRSQGYHLLAVWRGEHLQEPFPRNGFDKPPGPPDNVARGGFDRVNNGAVLHQNGTDTGFPLAS